MKKLVVIHKNLKHLYTGGQYRLARCILYFKTKHIVMEIIDRGMLSKSIDDNRFLSILYFIKFYVKNRKNIFSFVNHGLHVRLLIPFFLSRIFGNKYAVNCNQTFYNFRKNSIIKWFEFLCEYIFLHNASLLIFPSEPAVEYFRKLHLTKKKKAIVNPAANVWGENMVNYRNRVRNLLFVGQVREWKGLDILINALHLLNLPKLHLDVIGRYYPNSTYFTAIKKSIKNNHLAKRVIFHGHKSPKELAVFYKNADIFIMPSRYETFGMVLPEAMSFGLPIVASSIPTAKQIIKNGINGILYETENPQELAIAITKLISDSRLREKIQKNKLLASKKKRTWNMVACDTLETIKEYL